MFYLCIELYFCTFCQFNNNVLPLAEVVIKPVISPTELYHMLLSKNCDYIIMDVRAGNEFETSHINHKCCINVPKEIIPPG